jgi:hypothetical protein
MSRFIASSMKLKQIFKIVPVSLAAFLCASAFCQQPTPSIPTTGFPGLDQYRASRIAIYTDDFGELARYRDADAAVGPPAADEKRVVFLGDSTTGSWLIIFPESVTSIGASTGRAVRRCWCVFGRT